MKIYIDRIEKNKIVCICNNLSFDLPLELFPDITEGDVLILSKSLDNSVKENTKVLIDKLFE